MSGRAGTYRHKITIETPTETIDAFGQAVKSWDTYAQPFAAVEPLQGREFFASSEVQSEVTTRIRMHYQSGITTKMRVSYGGLVYDIQAVINPKLMNGELQLMCSEGVTNG